MQVSAYPSDPQKALLVSKWAQEFRNYIDATPNAAERKRMLRNYDYYDGVDHRQWQDKDLVAQLAKDGKPAHTFNWIMGLVDSMVGHLMQAPVGIKFVAPGIGSKEQTDALQALYAMDSERDDYESKFYRWMTDTLIHTGVLQLTWDKSDDRLGNVGVIVRNPKHVVRDPYWNSGKMRDSRATFVYSWMSADQIKSTWRTKDAFVDAAISQYAYQTSNNEPLQADRSQPYYDKDGNLFKVIEAHWCDTESVLEVLDTATGATIGKFSGPDYDGYSKDTLQAAAALENPDWKVVSTEKPVSKIFTFCPALSRDLVLEEGKYPLQLGRQPFLFFSYKEDYETRQGAVDKLIDAQDVFNKRQSMVSHALGGSTGAGVTLAERSVFNGDQEKIDDFQARITQNGQLIEVGDGALSEKRMREVNRPQIPMDILKSTEDQRVYLQDLAGITPGMQGYGDKSDESGKLYASKVRQAMIGLEMFSEAYKAKLREFARMYQAAAKQVYSGPSRKFIDAKKNEEFWINRTLVAPDGSVVKMQYVEEMPDYLVVVEEQRIGKANRESQIATYVELLRYVRNPIAVAMLETEIMRNLDFGEESTARFEKAANAWIEGQVAQVDAGKAQSSMVIKQAEQAMQPQPQQAPAGAPQPTPA